MSSKFECKCAPGFSPADKGFPCLDVEECDIVGDLCGEGECVNTPGSFQCHCNEGYQQGPDGKCVNVDECLQNVCLGTYELFTRDSSFEKFYSFKSYTAN